MNFPEENLLSLASERGGFFITSPGFLLDGGRYEVIRKLGRSDRSSTYLVKDLQARFLSPS